MNLGHPSTNNKSDWGVRENDVIQTCFSAQQKGQSVTFPRAAEAGFSREGGTLELHTTLFAVPCALSMRAIHSP